MGKKRVKKTNSNLTSKSDSLIKLSESDAVEKHEDVHRFTVLLTHYMEEKDKYKKWSNDCYWKNVAFIHPSVLSALGCGAYLEIKGDATTSVFMVYSLKTVKRSSVILLPNMGFEHEEVVSLHPFNGEGYQAEEIFFLLHPPINDCTKNLVRKKLSDKFIWPDLRVTIEILDTKYQIIVKNVRSLGQVTFRNYSPNAYEGMQSFSDQNVFNSSIYAKVTNESANEFGSSFVSDFSSMHLQDCSLDSHSSLSAPMSSQSEISSFFTVTYKTLFTFCDTITEVKGMPSVPIQHIGGSKEQIQLIRKAVVEFFNSAKQRAFNCPQVLLIMGPTGTGKTMNLKAICCEYSSNVEEISKESLYYRDTTDLLKKIKQKFANTNNSAPSILILDKIEELCPSNVHTHVSESLCNLIAICDPSVLIIATTADSSKYDKKTFSSCFVQKIQFFLPTTLERVEIIQKKLEVVKHELTSNQMKQCAEFAQGLSGEHIHSILKFNAPVLSLIRRKNEEETAEAVLKLCDVITAMKKKKTHIMSSSLKAKKVRWCDIGGMHAIKEKLMEEIELSQICPENMKRFNYSPSKGILLYGPPGCSKTMIAKALATECNWNFISKKSSNILNMYVGESEKAVTNIFTEARNRSPCIIFLDEIDALAPERTSCSNASGVGNRIVNALLIEMAGIETLKDIMVIAATNRPEIVDTALLRRGRIGHHIYIPLPDIETREDILKLSMRRRCFVDDVDFKILSDRTQGYTGAEIVHLCNEAAMQLLIADPDCKSPFFTMKHFEKALLALPPRTSKETIEFYEKFNSK